MSGFLSLPEDLLPCRWRLLASVIIDGEDWLCLWVRGAGLLSVYFTVNEELRACPSAWAHLGLPWPHRTRWGISDLEEVL